MSVESIYEYGSRVGVWRILNLFRERQIPITLFTVGMAAQRNPAVIERALKDNHEICSHGYRWWDYAQVPLEIEREHISRAIEAIFAITGEKPKGWYTGRTSVHTRKLVAEHGGFLYDADHYNDDLPFWTYPISPQKPHLVVPYTLLNNDMRFCSPFGFRSAHDFFSYIKDHFDTLYQESLHTPKMMSVGLHPRLIGQPGRIKGLTQLLDYILSFNDIWLCRRIDIAQHWIKNHQPSPKL
jgi:peptidoglycan/xylan/chitin deacetylase (PgdA/CDA1 family)